jgi:hypothetical protein
MTSNIKNNQTRDLNPESVRKKIVILLIGTIASVSLLIFLPPINPIYTGDISRTTAAAIATVFSWVVVFRQKFDGIFGRAYASLAIGLTLWTIAEIIWTYYELDLRIENPFPSPADVFYLLAYGPIVYFILKTYRLFGNSKLANIILVTVATIIFLGFYVYNTISTAELSTYDSTILFLISISYPIGDAIFIIPATLVILNAGKGKLTSVPWIFLGMLTFAAADSIFGYTSVIGINVDQVWNPLYIAGYLLLAAGIFWHNKYFIFDEKKLTTSWEEDNR